MLTIIFSLLLLAGMGFLLFRQIKTIRMQQADAKRLFQQRLLAPDWQIYAQHLQREVPEAMKQLYAEFALLLSEVEVTLQNGMVITEFFPLDAQALIDQKPFQPENLAFECLPFATLAGQELFLRPGSAADNRIYLFDGSDIEIVFPEITDLLNALRSHAADNSGLKLPN